MKLSTRVRYGVRALVELAKQENGQCVSLREIAENQEISPKYLEQMIVAMKKAGLVASVRGAEGGYRLGKAAEDITVWDVYSVLDISVDPIDCKKETCSRLKYCATRKMWGEMASSIAGVLKGYTLAELASREKQLQKKAGEA
jgi:Rrf2 family transcriptional regulator, cysteine metabolism repressor